MRRGGGWLSQRRSAIPLLRLRLHPVWLIPIFLLGSWYGPFAGEQGLRYDGPAYQEGGYDYDKAFLPPDAPPLVISDEEQDASTVRARSLGDSYSSSSNGDELGHWTMLKRPEGAPDYYGELHGYLYFPPQAPLVSVKIPPAKRKSTNPYLREDKARPNVGLPDRGVKAQQPLGGKAGKLQQGAKGEDAMREPLKFPAWPDPKTFRNPFLKKQGNELEAFVVAPPAEAKAPVARKGLIQNVGGANNRIPRPAVERDERGHVLGANAAAARKAARDGIPFKPKKPADLLMQEAREAAAKRKAALEEEAKRRQHQQINQQPVPPPAKLGFGANNPQVNARKEAAARAKAIEHLLADDPAGRAGALDLDGDEFDEDDEYDDEEEEEDDDDWENDLVLPPRLSEFERSFLSKEDLAVVDEYEAELAEEEQEAAGPARKAAVRQDKVLPGKGAADPRRKKNAPAQNGQGEKAAAAQVKEKARPAPRNRPADGRNRWKRSFEVEEPIDDFPPAEHLRPKPVDPVAAPNDKLDETETQTTTEAATDASDGLQGKTVDASSPDVDLVIPVPDSPPEATLDDDTAEFGKRLRKKRAIIDLDAPSTGEAAALSTVKGGLLHPISWLLKTAEERWQRMVSRQSQTLEQAVREYERRYKRRPPLGFDKWWKYAMENRIVLVDEYDQIMEDMEPFFSLPSDEIKRRLTTLVSDTTYPNYADTFTVAIKDGEVSSRGPGRHLPRAEDTLDLLSEFCEMLPDMRVVFSSVDGGQIHISGEARRIHRDMARAGKVMDRQQAWQTHESNDFSPFISMCDPESAARNKTRGLDAGVSPFAPSFVSIEHAQAMDYCQHPEIQELNGYTSWAGTKTHLLYPRFASSKVASQSDILSPAIEDYFAEVGPVDNWKHKWNNRVLWRGPSSGTYRQAGVNWRSSQRDRLVALTNDNNGTRQVRIADAKAGDLVRRFEGSTKDINEFYFDVAFSGSPTQCENADGSCKTLLHEYRFQTPIAKSQSNSYKYVIDVDGNGWSSEFRRLMQTGSVVLKSTIFPEWWSKRIMPWYHYIPVKSDYSDLHDVAAYFIGAPDGSGAHDDLAEKIGVNAKAWARDHWREVDLASYQFRLLLEYARLLNKDEQDYDFVL